jgi:nucleoside 2-deoxyribosyltransferase
MNKLDAFLGIKFHPDNRNQQLIEKIVDTLKTRSIYAKVFVKDIEDYGKHKIKSSQIMPITLLEIKKADIFIAECTEKGVGVGIEAGIAYASGLPVYVIAKKGSRVSDNMKRIAKQIIFYKDTKEISEKLKL